MRCLALFFATAVLSAGQIIPDHYIVEFETDPAVVVSLARGARFASSDNIVQARRTALRAEHAQAEQAVNGMGGRVTRHFDTIVNGMAVSMSATAAAQMRLRPGVRGVYPVQRHRVFMDQAASVHRFTEAWQSLPGGASSAGAGIKIGILDTGVDNTHPAFQNFGTPVPDGFPIISGTAIAANTNSKVIVSRVYSDLPAVDNTQSDGSDALYGNWYPAQGTGGVYWVKRVSTSVGPRLQTILDKKKMAAASR